MAASNSTVNPRDFLPTRTMLDDEHRCFVELSEMARHYDDHMLPLCATLDSVCPQATKIAQIQCIPIIGNLVVFGLSMRFAFRTLHFRCFQRHPIWSMLPVIMMVFVLGFIPFLGVWVTFKLRPIYRAWLIFSKAIDEANLIPGPSTRGMQAEYPSHTVDVVSKEDAIESDVAEHYDLAAVIDEYSDFTHFSVNMPPPSTTPGDEKCIGDTGSGTPTTSWTNSTAASRSVSHAITMTKLEGMGRKAHPECFLDLHSPTHSDESRGGLKGLFKQRS